MSKNIKYRDSFLQGFSKQIKMVEFGNGEIQIGSSSWEGNQHVLILADTEKPHEIGKGPDKKEGKWFEEVTGDAVCLYFNNAESVDAVIETLKEIKTKIMVINEAEND